MPTFYKLGKTAPVNWIGIDKTAAFRNSDAQLVSGNVRALDPCPEGIEFREPTAIVRHYRSGTKNPTDTQVVGYLPGELTVPSHYYRTGKWLALAIGTCSTSAATVTHRLKETSAELYFFQLHCVMEHATSSNCLYRDLLGNAIRRWHFNFGQDDACRQNIDVAVAKPIDGSDLAVRVAFEYSHAKVVYPAGQFTHTTTYGATSWGCSILSGDIELNNTLVHYKSGDQFPTSVHHKRRNWKLSLNVRLFNNTLLTLPDTPTGYTTNALTFYGKYWANANSNYMAMSFTNLRMDRPMGKLIPDEEYFWEGTIEFEPTGARVGVPANSHRTTVVDALSNTHYESG